MTDFILTEINNQVLTVRINRPERKNTLTHAMYTAPGDAIEQADADASIRCVLFAERLKSPEAAEAFGAFMQKRKPDFTNFK